MEKSPEQGVRVVERDSDPWRTNEEARHRQVREDAKRSLAANLAEGLALSEFLSTFTGSAKAK